MRGLTKKSLVTLNSPPSGRRSTRRGEVVGEYITLSFTIK